MCRQDCAKSYEPIFTKFGGKRAHGPRKKSLDFGDVVSLIYSEISLFSFSSLLNVQPVNSHLLADASKLMS